MSTYSIQKENRLDTETRKALAGRIEVLDKVKALVLMPKINLVTLAQIADYYDVLYDTAKKCLLRNRAEIEEDGAKKYTIKDAEVWKGQNVPSKNYRGRVEYNLGDGITLSIPNGGIYLFSKRAVLRFGMLLQGSEVAREVRTQLLNIFDQATEEQRLADLELEKELYMKYARAALDGTKEELLEAAKEAFDFKNRHIRQLEHDNKILAGAILTCTDRASVNKAVRCLGGLAHIPVSCVWKELYDQLRYKYSMGLSQRGPAPYIQHVRGDEWGKVQQAITAMCYANGVDAQRVMEAARMHD